VLHEQPVDENVAPADFTQEDTVSTVVEEAGIIERRMVVESQQAAQDDVLDASISTVG
jgi:hypothetical protein